MKLIILFCLITGGVFAQVTITVNCSNVQRARCIPVSTSPVFTVAFSPYSEADCANDPDDDDSIQLYFKFHVLSDDSDLNLGKWKLQVPGGGYSYKVYGPFVDEQTAVDQLESGSAPVKVTSSTSIIHDISVTNVRKGDCYMLVMKIHACSGYFLPDLTKMEAISCTPVEPDRVLDCNTCLGAFQPSPGKHVFSAWVKPNGGNVTANVMVAAGTPVNYLFTPSGPVIDDWQQINGFFEVPLGMTQFEITFSVSAGSALFDDIRIFPNEGSMLSYVYDPKTLRLIAELDERNYAKLYEYDQEGKLIRVKKETINGIMTITENRENSFKRP